MDCLATPYKLKNETYWTIIPRDKERSSYCPCMYAKFFPDHRERQSVTQNHIYREFVDRSHGDRGAAFREAHTNFAGQMADSVSNERN
jgi:hypothetical protein